jgi:hypothetical protein
MTVLQMVKQDVVDQVWYCEHVKQFKYAYISCFASKADGTSPWMGLIGCLLGEDGVDWAQSYYHGVSGWIDSDIRGNGGDYSKPTTIDELTQLPAFAKLPGYCTNYAIIYTDHEYHELQVKEKLLTGDLAYTPSLCKVLISPNFSA